MWLLNHHLLKLCSSRFVSKSIAQLCPPSLSALPFTFPVFSEDPVDKTAWWRSSMECFLSPHKAFEELGPSWGRDPLSAKQDQWSAGREWLQFRPAQHPLRSPADRYGLEVCVLWSQGNGRRKMQIVALGIELIFLDSSPIINEQNHKFLDLMSSCLKIFFSVYWQCRL